MRFTLIPFRIPLRGKALTAAVLAFATVLSGCSAFQSSSVETLIDMQGAKISDASAQIDVFIEQDRRRRNAYKNAVSDLDTAIENIRTFEAQSQLVFAASKAVDSLSGHDAEALGYLAGLAYWADHGRLDRAVRQQFDDDFDALERISRELKDSWASMDTLSNQLEEHAHKSGVLRSVDPAFLSALVAHTSVTDQDLDTVIRRSAAVNSALIQASRLDFVDSGNATRGASVLGAWVELLRQIRGESEGNND